MTFEASRSKQRLVLQPRGKPLYEEESSSNSFGLKMLETMGWKKGNGLGRNQQGNLDFIQVRYKNTVSGLGFDRLKDNQWTDNEHNFNELLQNLNSTNTNTNDDDSNEATKIAKSSSKSLEEMSKQSRARVHYKKFTKGKDVYKYSEKDLANIFGKKSLNESEKVVEPVEPETDKPDHYASSSIINTGISITDYFNQKRKREEPVEVAEEEVIEKVKKKKKTKSEPIVEITNDEELVEDVKPKKKKKKSPEKEPSTPEILPEPLKERIKSKKSKRKEVDASGSDVEKVDEEVKLKEEKVDAAETQKPEDPERPKGINAIYSTNVIQIPSHVAQKMSKMTVNKFSRANLGDIVGYGMSEEIEIKVIQTKLGDTSLSTDKYSIYNMDKVVKTRVNPRKILSKIKRTKKSIQVI